VAISSATLFCSTCAFFAAIVFLPLFLQRVQCETATNSGLLLLPMMLSIALSATASGRIISWTGRYKAFPIVGLAIMASTLLLFSRLDAGTAPAIIAGLMAAFGLGFGMVGEVLMQAVQNAVEQRELGTATGAANLFRALGGSVGVAVYGAILTQQSGLPQGISAVFLVAAPIAAAGGLLALMLEERPLRRQASAAAGSREAVGVAS
jgi:predicted MFS family arabinose efflux permease